MFSVILLLDCVSFGQFSLTRKAKAIFKYSQAKQLSPETMKFISHLFNLG